MWHASEIRFVSISDSKEGGFIDRIQAGHTRRSKRGAFNRDALLTRLNTSVAGVFTSYRGPPQ